VTISGLARNERVSFTPSLRPGKFRLKELTMDSALPFTASARFHCPMQGPQAFASTVPPICSKVSRKPSRFIVWKIRSEPGEIKNGVFALRPALRPCLAMCAARPMSS
jgi:hypothetical protein